jgi:hypothetical protein
MDTKHQATLATPSAAPISTATLLPAQRELLQHALADAISYQDPPLYCPNCQTPDRLCARCAAGLSQARAYLALSRELENSPASPDSHPGRPAHPATH